jgi:AcrR family transcriptional regulator
LVVTSSGSARGPYAKTASRIEHILDKTLELFAATGYRATTMKEIAEAAGITQPGLMHHFATKTDILIALLRRREERSPALAPEAGEAGPFERLLRSAEQIVGDRTSAALHCVLSAEATSPEHPAHAYFKERYTRVVVKATTAFADLQIRGAIQPDVDPAILAHMLIGLLDGLQLQWLLEPEAVDIGQVLHAFLQAFTTRNVAHVDQPAATAIERGTN